MSESHGTDRVRMIAQDVVENQAAICEERRGRIDDRLTALVGVTADNTDSVKELSRSATVTAATVTQLATAVAAQATTSAKQGEKLADHNTRISVMAVKVSVAAVVGGSLPSIFQWLYRLVSQ